MYIYTFSCNCTNMDTLFVRHVAEIREDNESTEETCETVDGCGNETIPIISKSKTCNKDKYVLVTYYLNIFYLRQLL